MSFFNWIRQTGARTAPSVFDWNNKQNGALIGSMGILSALLQGGYVRRVIPKVGEGVIARRGVLSCFFALLLLSAVPRLIDPKNPSSNAAVRVLQFSAVFMAYTSATVVNSLTSYASLQCDDITEEKDQVTGKPKGEHHPDLAKGKALGRFRSRGQLGRAIGPILGTRLNPNLIRIFLDHLPLPPAHLMTAVAP